jgi:sigma-B regulation protein RsbU (phosphoserine phosphatase)
MSADEPTAAASTIKVFLVDDQRMIGEVVRRMLLDQADIAFHFCDEPTEALARAIELRPDVILQDLVMPKISGLELVAQYRANTATATTPIIVLSASGDAAIRARSAAAGANDFIVKVPPRAALVARIRSNATPTGQAPPNSGSDQPTETRLDPFD